MVDQPYFPESVNELERLESKTDRNVVVEQAVWAGLEPGMRVLDLGCGPGLTTACLATVAGSNSSLIGLDRSLERIEHARQTYGADNVDFVHRSFFDDLSDLGEFDFVWIRFILEYFLKNAFQLVEHVSASVKGGGILCLADLDYNCLSHYGLPERLSQTLMDVAECQMKNNNFDPYAGRKLPTHLFDLGFTDIRSDVRPHHLVYGDLSEQDRWNWWQKIEFGGRRSGWTFDAYEDGFAGFEREFKESFENPRRFSYTPLIISRGIKPA